MFLGYGNKENITAGRKPCRGEGGRQGRTFHSPQRQALGSGRSRSSGNSDTPLICHACLPWPRGALAALTQVQPMPVVRAASSPRANKAGRIHPPYLLPPRQRIPPLSSSGPSSSSVGRPAPCFVSRNCRHHGHAGTTIELKPAATQSPRVVSSRDAKNMQRREADQQRKTAVHPILDHRVSPSLPQALHRYPTAWQLRENDRDIYGPLHMGSGEKAILIYIYLANSFVKRCSQEHSAALPSSPSWMILADSVMIMDVQKLPTSETQEPVAFLPLFGTR